MRRTLPYKQIFNWPFMFGYSISLVFFSAINYFERLNQYPQSLEFEHGIPQERFLSYSVSMFSLSLGMLIILLAVYTLFRRTVILDENGIQLRMGLFFTLRRISWSDVSKAIHIKSGGENKYEGKFFFIRSPHTWNAEGMPKNSYILIHTISQCTYFLLSEYANRFANGTFLPETSLPDMAEPKKVWNNATIKRVPQAGVSAILSFVLITAIFSILIYQKTEFSITAKIFIVGCWAVAVLLVLFYYKLTDQGIQKCLIPGIPLKMTKWEDIAEAGFYMDQSV